MEKQTLTHEEMQKLEEQLLEAWGQTGLLTNSSNKLELAKVLEATSRTILESKTSLTEEQVAYIATMTLPVITRALRHREFIAKDSANKQTESVYIRQVETEQEQIEECARAGFELDQRLSKYNSLVISYVKLSNFDNGFHLGLDCADVS